MTHRATETPLVVLQRDHVLLVRTDDGRWPTVRDRVRPFAELVRLGGGFATFRLTRALALECRDDWARWPRLSSALRDLAGMALPPATAAFIHETLARVGMIRSSQPTMASRSSAAMRTARHAVRAGGHRCPRRAGMRMGMRWYRYRPEQRGRVKLAFAALGYPIADDGAVDAGAHGLVRAPPGCAADRAYQRESVAAMARSSGGRYRSAAVRGGEDARRHRGGGAIPGAHARPLSGADECRPMGARISRLDGSAARCGRHL